MMEIVFVMQESVEEDLFLPPTLACACKGGEEDRGEKIFSILLVHGRTHGKREERDVEEEKNLLLISLTRAHPGKGAREKKRRDTA